MKIFAMLVLCLALQASAQITITATTTDGSTVELYDAYIDVNGSHQSVISVRTNGAGALAVKVADIESIAIDGLTTGSLAFARGTVYRRNGEPLQNVTVQFTAIGGWEQPRRQGAQRTINVRQLQAISLQAP